MHEDGNSSIQQQPNSETSNRSHHLRAVLTLITAELIVEVRAANIQHSSGSRRNVASSYPSWHGLIVKNIQVEKTTKNANQQNTKACVNCRIFPLVLSIVEAVNFRKKTEPTLIPASVQDWECAGKQQLQLQDSVHAVPLHITLRYLQGEYFRYFKSTTKQHALPLFFSKNKLQYIVWQFSRNYFIRFV